NECVGWVGRGQAQRRGERAWRRRESLRRRNLLAGMRILGGGLPVVQVIGLRSPLTPTPLPLGEGLKSVLLVMGSGGEGAAGAASSPFPRLTAAALPAWRRSSGGARWPAGPRPCRPRCRFPAST